MLLSQTSGGDAVQVPDWIDKCPTISVWKRIPKDQVTQQKCEENN